MKKILATLLVATMLMSCMTFVSFAAVCGVETVENPIGGEFAADCYSDAGAAYADYMASYKGITKKADKNAYAESGNDPVYTFVWNEEDELAITSYDVSKETLVQIPIYSTGDGITNFKIGFKYDSTKFTKLDFVLNSESGMSGTWGEGADAENYSAMATVNFAGYIGSLFFEIADGLTTNNSNGTATEIISINVIEANNSDGSSATVAVKDATINLSGLTYVPSEPVEDVYMTESEVVNAATAPVVAASGVASEGWAGTTEIISGDDKDISAAEAYSAVFGTIAVPAGKKVDARGFVLVDAEGNETFYAAKAITANGQFGIAFFGTEATLAKYKAAPAAKVGADILYDASDLAEL